MAVSSRSAHLSLSLPLRASLVPDMGHLSASRVRETAGALGPCGQHAFPPSSNPCSGVLEVFTGSEERIYTKERSWRLGVFQV